MKKQLLQAAKNFAKKAQKYIDDFKASGKADLAQLKNLFKENAKLLAESLEADVITDEQFVTYTQTAVTAYAALKGKTTLTEQEHAQFTEVINVMLSEIEAIEAAPAK